MDGRPGGRSCRHVHLRRPVTHCRIWPGSEAKRLKLVDELGGYATAFTQIRQLAKLPSQMPLTLVPFPRQRSPLETAMQIARTGRLPQGLVSVDADPRLAKLLTALGPMADLLTRGEDDVLLAPRFEIH